MRVERRDFLLLRAGQPAGLSCEQLFMRYIDAQMDGTSPSLFAALAEDLRGVTSVRLTDVSWLSRPDFRAELERVLAAFASAGGRIVAVLVAIAATSALQRL